VTGTIQMLQRIVDAIKSRGQLQRDAKSAPRDPVTAFPHPANRQLFRSFKRRGPEGPQTKSGWDIDEYPLRAHPDLVEFFRELDPRLAL
jgi:hypothetical protein